MHSMRSLIPQSVLRAILSAATIVAVLGAMQQARAAILEVAPVRLQFEPTQQGQELKLSNTGSVAVDAQVRVMTWTQENGQERLTPVPAGEVVASPPIMHIESGKQQLVRVIRVHPTAPSSELSYRVLIDELPKRGLPNGTGVVVLMRYSIPVFVRTASQPAPSQQKNAAAPRTDLSRVHAQVVAGPDGKAQLRVSNDGGHALRISALSTVTPGGQIQNVNSGLVGYVLAGQRMAWPLNVPYPLSPGLALKARFDDDTEAQAVPLDGAGN
jgi:fimbrial chaperone protein